MDFRLSPEEEAFRQEVRDWLKENLPKGWSGDRFTRDRDPETWNIYRDFAGKLAEKKWVAPAWPVEYGGLGLSAIQQLIFNEEMALHQAPLGYSLMGVGWAGPSAGSRQRPYGYGRRGRGRPLVLREPQDERSIGVRKADRTSGGGQAG